MTNSKSDKKILVVSQYFWPESFRINELVLELQKRGFSIEVLTSTPNYPSGKPFSDFITNPSKYKDYSGIKVHRVPQILRGNSRIMLALNYLSFVISASIYSLLKLRARKFDLIFAVQLSPIFSVIPAIVCKKIIGVPLYFWVLDIWPDSAISGGIKSKLIISFLKRLCVYIYSSADTLFLSSNGFKAKINQMGVTKSKFVYFPQWIETDYIGKIPLASSEDNEVKHLIAGTQDKIIFTFTGNIGEAQDFPNILRGLKNCRRLKDIIVLVIGDGRYKKELIKRIQAEELDDIVICLGQYPARYMPLFYYYSDYLIVSLKDSPISSYTLPGKIQSYMSSSRPLIGMINGEARQVIEDAGCGFTVASGDHIGFSAMLDQCCELEVVERKKLGKMGKSYSYKNFRLESLVDRIIQYF
jgi:colanic acid biosynthesis glycosyl transferase WcaI